MQLIEYIRSVVNSFEKNLYGHEEFRFGLTEAHAGNTGLAKVAVQYSADTFVVNQSLVLRINICGENRHLRQARKR